MDSYTVLTLVLGTPTLTALLAITLLPVED